MSLEPPTLGATDLDLERDLNPEQIAAVTHRDGPQLVLAGAGSGKTRVITYRIAWLIRRRQVPPRRIAAVTFTNKAAFEMAERVEALLGAAQEGLFVGTFHRFALRLLRRYGSRLGLPDGFGILDADDQLKLVKRALADEQLAEGSFPPRAMLARISGAKSRLLDPETFEAQAEDFVARAVARLYWRYQTLTKRAAGLDFDDLIVLAVRLLRDEEEVRERLRRRLRYLLVDEFQDTNHAQLELIDAVIGSDGQITAVGDEDQSIYRWRGAELRNILEFERRFPSATVRKLERNYRSTQIILDAAGELVACNEGRRGKRLWTTAGPGEPIELYRAADEGDEAQWVVRRLRQLRSEMGYGEMAVLVRTNAQTRALEDELLKHRVPYCLVAGVRFYERAEVKDLVAYLRVVQHPHDNVSLARILNRPARGIGQATRQLLDEEAAGLGNSLWDALRLGRLHQVSVRGRRALAAFQALIEDLQATSLLLPLPQFLERLLERSGYGELYSAQDAEGAARLENIGELLSAAHELAESEGSLDRPAAATEGEEASPLVSFLDHVALVSDTDSLSSEKGVSLMTLHSAKGLEFSLVAVTGLEDGLLPHFNARESREEVEEERRLLYVGMTRARRQLLLSVCRRRRVAGRYQDQAESPFVQELPRDLLNPQESPSLFSGERTRGVYSFFGRQPAAPIAPDEEGELRKGSRVRHPTLGEGVILELDGSGEGAKITVFFKRAGKKRMVAKYASLEPI